MKEMQLEFTCIYSRNYNLMLKVKEAGEDDGTLLDRIRMQVNREMQDKTVQVVEDYDINCHPSSYDEATAGGRKKEGITMQQFEKWMEHFEDEPFMVRDRENMEKLDSDFFVRGRI